MKKEDLQKAILLNEKIEDTERFIRIMEEMKVMDVTISGFNFSNFKKELTIEAAIDLKKEIVEFLKKRLASLKQEFEEI